MEMMAIKRSPAKNRPVLVGDDNALLPRKIEALKKMRPKTRPLQKTKEMVAGTTKQSVVTAKGALNLVETDLKTVTGTASARKTPKSQERPPMPAISQARMAIKMTEVTAATTEVTGTTEETATIGVTDVVATATATGKTAMNAAIATIAVTATTAMSGVTAEDATATVWENQKNTVSTLMALRKQKVFWKSCPKGLATCAVPTTTT